MNPTLSGPAVLVVIDGPPVVSAANDDQREVREGLEPDAEPPRSSRQLDRTPPAEPDPPDGPDGRDRQVAEPSWPWSWLTPR